MGLSDGESFDCCQLFGGDIGIKRLYSVSSLGLPNANTCLRSLLNV